MPAALLEGLCSRSDGDGEHPAGTFSSVDCMETPRVTYWLTPEFTCYRCAETESEYKYIIQAFDDGRVVDIGTSVVARYEIVSFKVKRGEAESNLIYNALLTAIQRTKP